LGSGEKSKEKASPIYSPLTLGSKHALTKTNKNHSLFLFGCGVKAWKFA